MNISGSVWCIDVNNTYKYVPVNKIYPGINASETIHKMVPHEKESFLLRCREWYKEAINQILMRVDLNDPVLLAICHLNNYKVIRTP